MASAHISVWSAYRLADRRVGRGLIMKSGPAVAGMLMIFLTFFSLSSYAVATQKNVTAVLSDQADQMVQYTDANQIQAAKTIYKSLDAVWTRAKSGYSETDQRTIDVQLDLLGSDLENGTISGPRSDRALSLRLSLDALAPVTQDSLWIQMKDPVLSTIAAMKSAARKNDSDTFYYQMNRFLSQYGILYPALVINGSGDILTHVDQLISGIGSAQMSHQEQLNAVSKLEAAVRQLFEPQDSLQHNRIQSTSFAIGTVLIGSLVFVSWRKFTGASYHWARANHNDR
jgi:Sporulation protein YpjB (SpoYpjB).